MTLLPLMLGVRRAPDAGKPSVRLVPSKAEANKCLNRDNFTCRFCGFRAEKFQQIVPHRDSGDALPFVTACIFCESCLRLEQASLMGAGILIWLPEISQVDLNHFMRAVYVARTLDSAGMEARAMKAFEVLYARRAEVKKRLGSDDPIILATAMLEAMSAEDYAAAQVKLEGVRLLPLERRWMAGAMGVVDQFPRIVDYWAMTPSIFSALPPTAWEQVFADIKVA